MRHVVVGASAAGLAAAESLLQTDPGAEVTLLSEEPHPPYCRPLISYWLARETPDDRFPLPSRSLEHVDLRTGTRAVSLDPERGRLRLDTGEELDYDRLCLATGAASRSLGLEGESLENVFGFRTWEDALRIDAELERGAERAAVLGGGLVGVKAALALAARGVETTLCVTSSHPLSQVVDLEAGGLVAAEIEAQGVRVRTGVRPVGFEERKNRATAVRFEGGDGDLTCDLVVRGKGVDPRTELVRGHIRDPAQGIPTDGELRTPLPNVWAAGDAARTFDVAVGHPRVNAIWPLAAEQGALAGRNMAGAGETYGGGVAMNAVKVGRLFLVSAGLVRDLDASCAEGVRRNPATGEYRKVVTRRGILVGVLFLGVGDSGKLVAQTGLLVSAIRRAAPVGELPFDPLAGSLHWGAYAFARAEEAGS